MKLFDLEAAKRGEPIVDDMGKPCTYVAHIPNAKSEDRVVVLHDSSGMVFTCQENGALFGRDTPHFYMAPVNHTRYIAMGIRKTGGYGNPFPLNSRSTYKEAFEDFMSTYSEAFDYHGIAEYTYED